MQRFVSTSIRWLVVVLAGLSVASIAPARAAEPFEIPTIMSLTGSAAFLGKSEALALQLAESMVNAHGGIKGRPVHFAVQDDGSNPQNAVQLTNAALASKPPVILGGSVVGVCNAMAAIVKAAGPVQYCFSPGIHPAKDSFTFSSSISTNDLAAVALRFFKGKHWTKIALITSTDASGQDAANAFLDAFRLKEMDGLSLVAQEHFNPTDVSVSAQMSRISAAHPDAVVAWSTGTPFGTLLRGISDAGLDVPILGGNGNLTYPQLAGYKGFIPKQMYFPSPRFFAREQVRPGPIRDAQNAFFTAFKPTGVRPDNAHSFSWDPALLVVDALRHTGVDASPDAVRSYLENLHGFTGINGLYDFRDGSQRGLGQNVAIIIKYDGATETFSGVSHPGGAPLTGR
jgi:branched-chain amino acid transport system substrate-binding protein